jgi:hypothetical protein
MFLSSSWFDFIFFSLPWTEQPSSKEEEDEEISPPFMVVTASFL